MSALKPGCLRTLVLTPERIPDFIIPTRSPLARLSPRLQQGRTERTRLLSDPDDDSPGRSPPGSPPSDAAPRRFLLRLPSPRLRTPRRSASAAESADTDLATRAAMSLPHVGKVTTPYGFRAVLAASPCTRRRESLFHQRKSVPLTVTGCDPEDPADRDPPPGSGSGPNRSALVRLEPVKALGQRLMKELKRPRAALKARSPATRDTLSR